MAENFALYSSRHTALPDDVMQHLGGAVIPTKAITERGLTYVYEWPDLKVIVSTMPPERIAEHLRGFAGYVSHIYKHDVPDRGQKITEWVLRTKLVVGIEVHPQRDSENRAEHILGSLCAGMRPIMFYSDALYDWMSRLVLAPDGSYDEEAELEERQ
jgi:hypothetical protein